MLILFLLAATMLVVYIREKIASYSVKAVLLKSVVSVLFSAVAVLGWYLSTRGILGIFIIIGLTFGLLGDIWLDLKYVFRNYDEQFTYAGFASFGIGHILYIAGLLAQYMSGMKLSYLVLPIALGAGLSFCNAMLEKPMKLHYGKMKGIVIGYGVLLFSTVLLSGSLALAKGWQNPNLNLFFAGLIFCSFRFGAEQNILRCWERAAHRYHFKLYSILWRPVSDRILPPLSLIISFAPPYPLAFQNKYEKCQSILCGFLRSSTLAISFCLTFSFLSYFHTGSRHI